MAPSIGCPSDDDDTRGSELDDPTSGAEPFDWNQWGIDIDTKNIDALRDGDDGGPSSVDIKLFRRDCGGSTARPHCTP